MNINTKFNFGDTVFFMRENAISSGEIIGIKSTTFEVTPTKEDDSKCITRAHYQVCAPGKVGSHQELDSNCFVSPADLLDALLVNYTNSVKQAEVIKMLEAQEKEFEEIKKL